MQISDFFNQYPSHTDINIASIISTKQEFLECKSSANDPFPLKGEQFPHQKFNARYVINSDCNHLIIDEAGTGKSCVIEYITRLLHNKYIEDTGDVTQINRCVIIVSNDVLEQNIKHQILCKCNNELYMTDAIRKSNPSNINMHIMQSLSKWLDIMTYGAFITECKKNNESNTLDDYLSNKYFLADEAHNLITMDDIKLHSPSVSYNFKHKIMHSGYKNKWILFTATPIINDVREFPLLMNLILPDSRQFAPKYKIDTVKFNDILPYLRGMCLYTREGDIGMTEVYKVNPDISHNGKFTKYDGNKILYSYDTTIYLCNMTPFQYQVYLNTEYNIRHNIIQGTFDADLSQVSNLIYPNGKYGKTQRAQYMDDNYNYNHNDSGNQIRTLFSNRDAINYFSCKASEALKICDKHMYKENKIPIDNTYILGTVFIFVPDHVNGSGSRDIVKIFCEQGYELFDYNNSVFDRTAESTFTPCIDSDTNTNKIIINKRPRIALLTGVSNKSEYNAMFECLNSNQNRYGEYIHVIVTSDVGQEGINITNGSAMIKFAPQWNPSNDYQSRKRLFRADSNIFRRKDNLPISMYNLAAVYLPVQNEDIDTPEIRGNPSLIVNGVNKLTQPNLSTVDINKYMLVEDKNRSIRRIIRFIKRASVNCWLNYGRNVRDTDIDGCPTCDYDLCNYECTGYNPKDHPIDYTTKDLNYIDLDFLTKDKESFTNLINVNNKLSIEEIQHHYKARSSTVVIALCRLLETSPTFCNRYGQVCNMYVYNQYVYIAPLQVTGTVDDTLYSNDLIVHNTVPSFKTYMYNLIDDRLSNLVSQAYNDYELFDELDINHKISILEHKIKHNVLTYNTLIPHKYNTLVYVIDDDMPAVIAEDKRLSEIKNKSTALQRVKKSKTITNTSANTVKVIVNIFSELQERKVAYNDVAKFNKGEGTLRILKYKIDSNQIIIIDDWRDVTAAEKNIYNKFIQNIILSARSKFEDQYQVYGLIIPPEYKFRLVDKRYNSKKRGIICTTIDKDIFVEYLYMFNIRFVLKKTPSLEEIQSGLQSLNYNVPKYNSNDQHSYDKLIQMYGFIVKGKHKVFRGTGEHRYTVYDYHHENTYDYGTLVKVNLYKLLQDYMQEFGMIFDHNV
jgi:hypothetical protein